jgi:hypothetical protein
VRGFAYIDFERSTTNDFYLVGTKINEVFKQTVLTPRLSGYATKHGLKVMSPDEFASIFCDFCRKHNLTVAAYTKAEGQVLQQRTDCTGLNYLDLHKAAKKWINKFRRADYEALPQLGVTMNLLPFQHRQLRNSLYSISRLIDEQQLDELKIPHFPNYGWHRVSNWFQTVITGLEQTNGRYGEIARFRKKSGTKALRHNRFDVQILPRLHAVIDECDPNINARCTIDITEIE